jgi:hypothetical protein
MEGSDATAESGAALLRVTFFSDEAVEADDFGPDRRDLHDFAEAVDQVAGFLEGAFLLAEWDELTDRGITPAQRASIAREHAARSIEIVSISMNTPFGIVVKIPAAVIGKLAGTAIDLAERICVFRPRVRAVKEEEKARQLRAQLEQRMIERQKTLIDEGRADAIALQILTAGRVPGVRPDRMDFIDADADDEGELVEIEAPRGE